MKEFKDQLNKAQQTNIMKPKRSYFNSKYKWSMRKYWISWCKSDFKRWYYSKMYLFNMDVYYGTMTPSTGKGKYVSVYSKGEIIQIKHESGYEHLKYDEIRIIPCKENHGVMVEQFQNGKRCGRYMMDLSQFNKDIIFASNVEQLASR